MRVVARIPLLLMLAVLAGCGPVPDPRAGDADLRPPLVQDVRAMGPGEISIEFDENATLALDKTRITPSLALSEAMCSGTRIVLKAETQTPGQQYTLEAEAQDAKGNSASFIADFYGFNPAVPRLLINELTPRGSGNHPDLVELKALSKGDMGGVVLYQGTPGNFDTRFVFPSSAVTAGCFIIVHFKPTGDPGEIDETDDMTASKGFDASDKAYDFWVPGGKGLAGNNGVLSLYDRPGGTCVDGILYSNRTSQSDESYRGFGTEEMLARAEELVRDGGWKSAGARVLPEDAVNPEGSTGTRSICRQQGAADTNSPEDWHIVPTRKATFGSENSNEVYTP